jgi:hypothetical protein
MLIEFLIDRHRVVFDSGIGWHCVCAEFAKTQDCRHTRESAGRRLAQDYIRNRTRPENGLLLTFADQLRNAARQDQPVLVRRP